MTDFSTFAIPDVRRSDGGSSIIRVGKKPNLSIFFPPYDFPLVL